MVDFERCYARKGNEMGIFSGVFGTKATEGVDVEKRFEFLSKPINGSMSTYQPVRKRTSSKVYGLKILHASKTTQFRERFKGLDLPSEAEVTSSFDHDNIVRLIDSGRTKRDQDYLLLEHCDGIRLDEAITLAKKNSAQPKSVLLLEMIRAVGVVHDAGFIHRDICPRNFFLDVKTGRIKLFDFGVSLPNKPEFLQPGNRTGSTMYLAPEIVRRRSCDLRADIFALGVSMFELLAWQHPWEGCSSSLDFDTQDPASLASLCPDLDENLAKVIHRCIEPNPEYRFEGIKQLLFAFRGIMK